MKLSTGETIVGRLTEGKYPDFTKIVPKQFSQTVTVDRLKPLAIIKD